MIIVQIKLQNVYNTQCWNYQVTSNILCKGLNIYVCQNMKLIYF